MWLRVDQDLADLQRSKDKEITVWCEGLPTKPVKCRKAFHASQTAEIHSSDSDSADEPKQKNKKTKKQTLVEEKQERIDDTVVKLKNTNPSIPIYNIEFGQKLLSLASIWT